MEEGEQVDQAEAARLRHRLYRRTAVVVWLLSLAVTFATVVASLWAFALVWWIAVFGLIHWFVFFARHHHDLRPSWLGAVAPIAGLLSVAALCATCLVRCDDPQAWNASVVVEQQARSPDGEYEASIVHLSGLWPLASHAGETVVFVRKTGCALWSLGDRCGYGGVTPRGLAWEGDRLLVVRAWGVPMDHIPIDFHGVTVRFEEER
jgi:hypothetical protein